MYSVEPVIRGFVVKQMWKTIHHGVAEKGPQELEKLSEVHGEGVHEI